MQNYDITNIKGYIELPLPFIRLLLVKPEETGNVIRYAVYKMTSNYDADTSNIFRQVLYVYYQTHIFDVDYNESATVEYVTSKPDSCLPDDICSKIEELWQDNKLSLDFDRKGFNYEGNFLSWGDNQIAELEDYASTDATFFDKCATWYKIRQVCSNIGIPLEDVNVYEISYNRFASYNIDDDIYVYVNTTIILRYFNNSRSGRISELERVQFACYAGIKSIVGLKDYWKASKELILARMMGLRSSGEITTEILNRKERTEANRIYKKYSQRRRFVGLLNKMLEYGYIKCCFGKKKCGYCLSTKLTEDEVMERELEIERNKILARSRVQSASDKFARKMQLMKSETLGNSP